MTLNTDLLQARYAHIDRLPDFGGKSIQGMMGALRARLIARYKLVAVPGRPEELKQPHLTVRVPLTDTTREYPGKRVSTGYGCGTIRIRLHSGPRQRDWVDRLDLQVRPGWHGEVYAFLDPFFGYHSHSDPRSGLFTNIPRD